MLIAKVFPVLDENKQPLRYTIALVSPGRRFEVVTARDAQTANVIAERIGTMDYHRGMDVRAEARKRWMTT